MPYAPTPRPSRLNFLLGLFSCALAVSAFAAPPALTVSGSRLVANGQNVRLVGVNIMGYEYSSTGDRVPISVIPAIDLWKAKIIRLPISQDYWMGYLGADANTYHAAIDKVVNTASSKGVYVIVDLHWSDMGQWGQNHGQHCMPDDNTAIAWADIANHFKNNPAVLFGVYNEPHDVSWSVWLNGGSVTETLTAGGSRTYHTPGIQSLIDTIRSTGATNVINVGGLGWANDLSGVVKTTAEGGYRPTGTNLQFEAHLYSWSGSFSDFDAKVTSAKNAGLCVHIGEFGADPVNDAWIQQLINWIDSNHYNFTGWCFYGNGGALDLLQDWTNFYPTPHWGIYVKTSLALADRPSIDPNLPAPRLVNISTRSFVGTGGSIQIAGIVISGSQPKTVLIRANGPALTPLGVPGVLADPVLTLLDKDQVQIAQNDDWSSDSSYAATISSAVSAAGAFTWTTGSKDAAIVTTLAPGAYTAQVIGKNSSTGVALVEVYEVGSPSTNRLINISTRSETQTGANIQIAGFVIQGTQPKKVLIRANGPSLVGAPFNVPGTLDDPVLTVYLDQMIVAQNDDWSSNSTQAAITQQAVSDAGAFAWTQGSKDAALFLTLAPGAYTAQVSGKNGSTGVTLIEVYEVP